MIIGYKKKYSVKIAVNFLTIIRLVSIVHVMCLEMRISRAEIGQATEGSLETHSQTFSPFHLCLPIGCRGDDPINSSYQRNLSSRSLPLVFRQNSRSSFVLHCCEKSSRRVRCWVTAKNLHVVHRVPSAPGRSLVLSRRVYMHTSIVETFSLMWYRYFRD